jgi:hypothetical protein
MTVEVDRVASDTELLVDAIVWLCPVLYAE